MKPMDHSVMPSSANSPSGPLIVHVVRQYHPSRGGLEDVVTNLCLKSIQAGFRVRVVTLDRLFTKPESVMAHQDQLGPIEIVRMPWRGSSRYPIAPSVLDHIKDADIVHVHAIDFFFDFLALTRFVHRKPLVVTTHGGFFHTRKFAAIKDIWFKTITRFSVSRYDAIVACGRSDSDLFSRISRRVRIVENGIDTAKFADAASETAKKRLVTIGRFSNNKRLDRLIAMMRALVDRDDAWQLDILGVASDLSEGDVLAMVATHSLQDNVHLKVNLSNDEIRRSMCGASFFASASEYEGFGLVAIEAMSAGLLPVLEGNAAYIRLAERHDDIIIAEFSDPSKAADAMQAAWQRASTTVGLRETLIRDVSTYSWDTAAEAYFDVYRTVLAKDGA